MNLCAITWAHIFHVYLSNKWFLILILIPSWTKLPQGPRYINHIINIHLSFIFYHRTFIKHFICLYNSPQFYSTLKGYSMRIILFMQMCQDESIHFHLLQAAHNKTMACMMGWQEIRAGIQSEYHKDFERSQRCQSSDGKFPYQLKKMGSVDEIGHKMW